MNLASAQQAYRDILAGLAKAAAGKRLPERDLLEARRRLDAVRKQAMHSIDQYTARRFVSVNTRRGLTTKLEQLHQQAHAELRALTGEQSPDASQ